MMSVAAATLGRPYSPTVPMQQLTTDPTSLEVLKNHDNDAFALNKD